MRKRVAKAERTMAAAGAAEEIAEHVDHFSYT